MKKMKPFVLMAFIFLIISCENTIAPGDKTKETPKEIPGDMSQVKLDWPSLANTPWPMNRNDAQGTGRTNYTGPNSGQINWKLHFDGVQSQAGFTSFVIGPDSTIYFGSSYEKPEGWSQTWVFHAVSHNGQLKWSFKDSVYSHQEIERNPLITADGTIIFQTTRDKANIWALNSDGTLRWHYIHQLSMGMGELTLGKDGTIYFIDWDGNLNALSSEGTLIWTLPATDEFKGKGNTGIAISPDGNTLYVPGFKNYHQLYAVSTTGELLWSFDSGDSSAVTGDMPLVDNQGNIYIQAGQTGDAKYMANPELETYGLFALNPDGTVRWRVPELLLYGYYTMDLNGHIYLLTIDHLIAVDYAGGELWRVELPTQALSPIIIDKNGILYTACSGDLIAVNNQDGTILWQTSLSVNVFSSPAIGYDKTLYFGYAGSDGEKYLNEVK